MITIEYPLALPSLANARLHWRTKAALVRKQRAATWFGLHAHYLSAQLNDAGVHPIDHDGRALVVSLTRCAPRRIRDVHDNLPAALKHVVDEVAAYFGIDDSDARIEWRYAQEKAATSTVRISFHVEWKSPTERGEQPAAHYPVEKRSDARGRLPKRRPRAVPSVEKNR